LFYRCEMRRLSLSRKCVLLLLGVLLSFPVWAQIGAPASVAAAAQPEAPKDRLGRSTPRRTVLAFLAATRKGDNELGAQYLNTGLRGHRATDLAHKLFVVLDRRLPARLNELTDKPEGTLSGPQKPDQEVVGTISSDNRNVDIIVERVDRGNSGPIWLFSHETLDSIPDLYEQINVVSADNVLPEFLVNARFAGIALFEWLAVFVGIPLFYAFAALLNRLLSPLVGGLRRRLYRQSDLPNPEALPVPLRLLLQAFVIRWLLTKVGLPLLARQFWSGIATIITIAGCVWLAILLNNRGEEYIRRRLGGRNLTAATSMLRRGEQFLAAGKSDAFGKKEPARDKRVA
jgi:MscS family membrane protein